MKIKQFNGRGQSRQNTDGTYTDTGHVFIGARSVNDAVRLMREAGFTRFTRHELEVYFSRAWGNSMKWTTLQRGVWVMPYGRDYNPKIKPEKIA